MADDDDVVEEAEDTEFPPDIINDTLFTDQMAWFAPTVPPSIVNSFLAGGGTVAVEHSLPSVTLLMSNDPLDPDTAAILSEMTRLVIEPSWVSECIIANVLIKPISPYLLRPVTLRSKPNIIDAYKIEAAAAARIYTELDAQANVSQTKRKRAILTNQSGRDAVAETVKKLKENDMQTDEAQVIDIVPPKSTAPFVRPMSVSPLQPRARSRQRRVVEVVEVSNNEGPVQSPPPPSSSPPPAPPPASGSVFLESLLPYPDPRSARQLLVSAVPASQESNQPMTQEFARNDEDNEVQRNPTASRQRTPVKSPVRPALRISQTARGRRAHFTSAIVSIPVADDYDDTTTADADLYWPMGVSEQMRKLAQISKRTLSNQSDASRLTSNRPDDDNDDGSVTVVY